MASPKTEQLNIKNVRGPGVSDTGSFRVMGELFGWRNSRTSEVIQLEAKIVDEVEWLRISPREYMLSFVVKDTENRIEFAGFRDHDFDVLHAYFKEHWGRSISTNARIGTKGWHWGDWAIRNKRFCLDVDGRRTLEIPLSKLVSVQNNKSDITLELKNKDTLGSNDDVVTEIRFCVPPPKEGDSADNAELVKATILDASGLGNSDNSSMVCAFSYKNCLQPPGRFDVQFFSTSLRLHGKSFDYRIIYDNIADAYVLGDVQSSKLLLTLINPLKKGNTKYPAVIVCLEDKVEETLTLNGSQEIMDELQKSLPNIDRNAATCEVIMMEPLLAGKLLEVLGKKKILGDTTFKGASGQPSFACSHKIHSGWFYPLNNEFVYLAKPVISVKYPDIASVNLGRTQGQQTRLFEFSITLKSGAEYEFNQVERQELQPFVDFVQQKGLKMKEMVTETREEGEEIDQERDPDELEGESEDEDFTGEDEEEDDEDEEEDDHDDT